MTAKKRTMTVIEPTAERIGGNIIRVAAYCRVSTEKSDQENSYETQKIHFLHLFAGSKVSDK